jgi:hypothetical protein
VEDAVVWVLDNIPEHQFELLKERVELFRRHESRRACAFDNKTSVDVM